VLPLPVLFCESAPSPEAVLFVPLRCTAFGPPSRFPFPY
jgi:hypothetical protein